MNIPLVSFFSLVFTLNYFGFYFEQTRIFGVTAAKLSELALIFLISAATLIRFRLKKHDAWALSIFYLIFSVSVFRSGFIADFLRKEYIVLYFGVFYVAGYTLSGFNTYTNLFILLRRLFIFVALVGVVFFIFGIDYKLEIYSEDEGNFYHPDLGRPRATSFLYNPQAFGMICVMAILMNGHFPFIGSSLIGLYLSYSRSSVISLVVSSFTCRGRKIAVWIFFALVVYMSFTLVDIPGFSRYLDFTQYIEDVRVLKFLVGLSALSDSPWALLFGVPEMPIVAENGITFSDNVYIYLALKGGVVLLAAYLYFLFRVFLSIRANLVLKRIFFANVVSGFFTISFAYIGFNLLFLLIGSYVKSVDEVGIRRAT